jgi:hypothetical protein
MVNWERVFLFFFEKGEKLIFEFAFVIGGYQ